LEILEKISSSVKVPVIASGWVGKLEDIVDGIRSWAHAVLAASIFHYNEFSIPEVKQFLQEEWIPMRI
jgi:cyclase